VFAASLFDLSDQYSDYNNSDEQAREQTEYGQPIRIIIFMTINIGVV
jgi:hypothetical protein